MLEYYVKHDELLYFTIHKSLKLIVCFQIILNQPKSEWFMVVCYFNRAEYSVVIKVVVLKNGVL